ncbi:hypothetical protein GZH47_15375 [Paenibacillus rhizovicinus]|uniref:TNase-like domain-containing protein n=1 Tax=Paenibacillus rhizovicinus TaxID=2704463 RepID=A0A6C0P2I7_9BACL|nr:stalk domain-containing protein [Paenibacillus rhizovicinus]QHW32053.1 hypothetical protein GZH47_15375 [Paenibacillus rhizovicinus]
MRIIIASLLSGFVLLCFCIPVSYGLAGEKKAITVQINGMPVPYEVSPIRVNGAVMVPMRETCEQLGAEVDWDGISVNLWAAKGDQHMFYQIGKQTVLLNESQLQLASPGMTVDGTLMMPLRFVAEAFGATVRWDASMNTVHIQSAPRIPAVIEGIQDGMYIVITYQTPNGNATEHVRLAGLSPIRNGMEATEAIRALLPAGSNVDVEFWGARDRNQNLWAAIYTKDGILINRELVARGYAKISTLNVTPYLQRSLVSLQQDAQSAKLGEWANHEPFLTHPIKTASIGQQILLVTDTGELWSWGQFFEKPTKILDHVAQVQEDSDVGIALKTDGTVWVWGSNFAGAWGNGEESFTATEIPRQVEGLAHIVSIEANGLTVMAINDRGAVYAWGSTHSGRLGIEYDPWDLFELSPIQLDWADVKQVQMGYAYTMVLKNDGTLWQTQSDSSELKQVKGLKDVTSVSLDNTAVLALKKDGTVWGWDELRDSYFGSGDMAFPISPAPVKELSHIVQVASGFSHFFAVNADGDLYGWGANGLGELGIDVMNKWIERPMLIPTVTGVTNVFVGSEKSLFLKQDQTLWGSGRNPYSILGEKTLRNNLYDADYHLLTEIALR